MKFLDCGVETLGIYPLVDNADKLEALYKAGISTAQLRVKNISIESVESQIIEAIKVSEKFGARLFINDYWQLAIKHNAYGVHLGQEDVLEADIEAICEAGIRLGISTHIESEIDKVLHIRPSYLAIGPIFKTNSKKMTYSPVKVERLKKWAKNLGYPIVAIGGIDLESIEAIVKTKSVNGIAMISGVLENGKVSEAKVKELISIFRKSF